MKEENAGSGSVSAASMSATVRSHLSQLGLRLRLLTCTVTISTPYARHPFYMTTCAAATAACDPRR